MKILRSLSRLLSRNNKVTSLLINKNCILQDLSSRRCVVLTNKHFYSRKTDVLKSNSTETTESNEEFEDLSKLDENLDDIIQEQYVPVKNALYFNSNDPLINKLNNIESLPQLFNELDNNFGFLKCEHLAQTVLVLWDLQRMYFHYNVENNSEISIEKLENFNKQFVEHLEANTTFNNFLILLKSKLKQFDVEALSYVFLYLNKMGLKQTNLLQLIENELWKKLDCNLTLSALSRFMQVKFADNSKGVYFTLVDYIPKIYEAIDVVESSNDWKYLTVCLQCLIEIINEETLLKYKKRLNFLIDKNTFSMGEHHIILKSVLFLSHSKWRDFNVALVNKCFMLFNNNLHLLSLNDLLLLYDVFQKNQEPAFIMNELYRSASKYFVQFEENSSPLLDIRLKLLVSLSSYCSPQNRPAYNNLVNNFMEKELTGNAIFDMYKLLIVMKSSNNKLNKKFWDTVLVHLIKNEDFRKLNLLKLSSCYINFYQDVNNFRHFYFEKKVSDWLQFELENGYQHLIPSYFGTMAAFLVLFSKNEELYNKVLDKIKLNATQFGNLEFFMLARSFCIRQESQQKEIPVFFKEILESFLKKQENQTFNKLNLNSKASIYIENMEIAEKFCKSYENYKELSSRNLKNVIYCLYTTDVLLPDVLDNLTEYVVKNKDNVLGYNAEKTIFLCYHFGYSPKSGDDFFNAIIDISLRDQERMTGLAYIQTCLSLCYFHQLPNFLIKHVFNELFLEKLDQELANCYYRDKYPIRVRHRMMQLNRAVCLDYPESNVPWFHQKYIEETKLKITRFADSYNFSKNIKDYLLELFDEKSIFSNFITPYGYLIDFVVDFKNLNSIQDSQKLALLLMRPGSHSKVFKQIKGPYQLKMRHLEILGYKTIAIDYEDWNKLASGSDKVNCLKSLIFSPSKSLNVAKLNS